MMIMMIMMMKIANNISAVYIYKVYLRTTYTLIFNDGLTLADYIIHAKSELYNQVNVMTL